MPYAGAARREFGSERHRGPNSHCWREKADMSASPGLLGRCGPGLNTGPTGVQKRIVIVSESVWSVLQKTILGACPEEKHARLCLSLSLSVCVVRLQFGHTRICGSVIAFCALPLQNSSFGSLAGERTSRSRFQDDDIQHP